jgi:hypothetical protein
MWKNMVKARQVTDDNIIRRMRVACWATKARDTHSVYVIIIAFSTETMVYVFTYISWLVIVKVFSIHMNFVTLSKNSLPIFMLGYYPLCS